MSLRLRDTASDFRADTTQGPVSFHRVNRRRVGDLFSHPARLHPGLLDGARLRGAPQARLRPASVKAIGLSIDPVDSHAKWSDDIETTQGLAPNFPIIADPRARRTSEYAAARSAAPTTQRGPFHRPAARVSRSSRATPSTAGPTCLGAHHRTG
jgi:thioredoxin-dependent peroxiredoxin